MLSCEDDMKPATTLDIYESRCMYYVTLKTDQSQVIEHSYNTYVIRPNY